MKKILFIIFAFMASLFIVNATDLYVPYEFSYADTPANTIYIDGNSCQDNGCTQAGSQIEVYTEGLITDCWVNYGPDGSANLNDFNQCTAQYRDSDRIVSGNERVFVKSDEENRLAFFSTNGDNYLVMKSQGRYQCEGAPVCFIEESIMVEFEKKDTAIAEIQQLNIINLDDENKPVQVEVPVRIDETVCSAFRFTDPEQFRPQMPAGYSDYSAETQIDLYIKNTQTGTQYEHQAITIPIEADTCAGLAAFSWTPDSSLENTQVTFRAETDVTDNQVVTSIPDWTEAVETVYPENLDGTCWARAYDFTLSNTNEFDLTPSVAQYTQGETLFALFRAAAYRDNSITPMNFEYKVYFNGALELTESVSTVSDLTEFNHELTQITSTLEPGSYTVKLEVTPVGTNCDIRESVEQIQNLQVLAPELYDVTFIVRDEDSNRLENAQINLELLAADDYYVTPPTYDSTLTTDANGIVTFTDVYAGNYSYDISKEGYTSIREDSRHIASDASIYITMPEENTVPIVALPDNFTQYYQTPIYIDLSDYVYDFNDGFNALNISTSTDGSIDVSRTGKTLTIRATQPVTTNLRVYARDPSGSIAFDDTEIIFTDNEVPVIDTFAADPSDGAAPFTTYFHVGVSDDDENVTCSIYYGDGTYDLNRDCDSLNNVEHTYEGINTYTARLIVEDGVNEPVEAQTQIFVFERINPSPVIDHFNLSSSNGMYLPTNLTLDWSASHTHNYPNTCTIRIVLANETTGTDYPVNCTDTIDINEFNVTGSSRFMLRVEDNESIEVIRIIDRSFFYEEEVDLELDDVEIIVEDKLVPGEFEFTLKIPEEIVDRRVVEIEPKIKLNGVVGVLTTPGGKLSSSAISTEAENDANMYTFKVDTRDFNIVIPKGEVVTLQVMLEDDFGTDITVNKSVVFGYEETESSTPSIRGKGTDVMDYMQSVAVQGFEEGFNTVEFKIDNNENEGKSISVSMISNDLGISYSSRIDLGAYGSREVQMPVYVKPGTEPGMYPVRFSVYDGEDKQVRYSFIKVNDNE
ncbi:MAG: hypothetical protein ACOCXG_00245 [Nanoarchaeota archaeon]